MTTQKTQEQIAQDIITKLRLDDFFGETTAAIVTAMNQARRQALEEAANICEENVERHLSWSYDGTIIQETRSIHRHLSLSHSRDLEAIKGLIDKEETK